MKLIKDVWWSGSVWVGECFFWYQPKRTKGVKRLCVFDDGNDCADWHALLLHNAHLQHPLQSFSVLSSPAAVVIIHSNVITQQIHHHQQQLQSASYHKSIVLHHQHSMLAIGPHATHYQTVLEICDSNWRHTKNFAQSTSIHCTLKIHWNDSDNVLLTAQVKLCQMQLNRSAADGSISAPQTHTHTHVFNGSFSGTTRVSRYQKGKTNLDFIEARDSEWQWHQLGHMQVCT